MEGKKQIVVQVVWFAAGGGDAVHIGAGNCELRSQDGARFLDYFAAGGGVDAVVGGFDVASREQPAIQAAVVDE